MVWPENIPPEERKVVEELRRRTIDDLTPKLHEDESVFYRFCKARDFNLADAETMLRKHIEWRKEYKIDTILAEYKPPEILDKYVPSSFFGYDKEGSLVRYIDFGNADYKGILRSVKKSDLLQYLYFISQHDEELTQQQSVKLGKPVTQYIHICNFENLTFAKATHKKTIETAMQFLKTFQDNYPERLKIIYHINVSFYYTAAFNIMKTVMASPLLQKIRCFTSDEWKEALLENIDADILPAFLGGNRTDPDGDPLCKTFVNHGEEVPERYYMSNSEKKLSKANGAEKLHVPPFSKVERSIYVQEAGFYLEWEFETKSRDIGFSVYFNDTSRGESKPVELVPKQRIDTCYELEKGLFKCEKVGKYTVVFDNSYSWLHPKEIYYRARVIDPKENEV